MSFCLPENLKIVNLYQGAANAVDCDVVSLKNAVRAWIKITHTGEADTDLVLTLAEVTAVGGTPVAFATDAKKCPIWVDADMGPSSDTLARGTDAYAYTIDTGTAPNQMVIWQVDPAILSAGYDCITLTDSGGNASNIVSIEAILDTRYKGSVLPTAIAD
jgi:hypothetical protein